MGMSTKDLWRLAVQSKLLSADQGKVLAKRYASVPGANHVDDAKVLAEWLVSENAISRYQSKVLLAGRAGPFQYGDYQVYDRISDGRLTGMFRAIHSPTRHPVLLAFLSSEDAKNPRRWATIASQTQTWARTSHPNLMRVFEPVDVSTHKFVVLEDVRGQSLEQLLQAGPRQYQEAAVWTQQAAMALAHLHRAKMVHGDVRPATLWIADGQLKLLVDPRQTPTAPAVTQPDPTGQLLERADYFAPEFASGRKLPDTKTDIYALGCSFYQMLSGRPPFGGGDVSQKLQRHANEAVQPLDPSIPQAIGQLVSYMMAKSVDVRYQEADPVTDQLRPFIPAPPSPPPTPETLAPYVQQIKQKQAELAAKNAAPVVSDQAGAMEGVPGAVIDAPSSNTSLARRPKKKDKTAWIIGGACAAVATIIAIVVIAGNQNGNSTANNDPSSGNPTQNSVTPVSDPIGSSGTQGATSNKTKAQPPKTKGQGEAAEPPPAPDDGESLWASPTTGANINLDYVPLSSLAYISSRPASLLSHEDGARVQTAMGTHFESLVNRWEKRAGMPLKQVDSLLIGLHENGDQFPRPSYVVRLLTPRPQAELIAAWSATEVDGGYYKGGGGDFFYIPKTQSPEAVGVFTMGAENDIKDVVERRGTPPNTRSGFAELLGVSDNDRHINVIFSPFDVSNKFFHEGRTLYFGAASKLREPIEWLLGEDLKAVAASMHVTPDQTYMELRFSNNLDVASNDLAKQLRARITEIPQHMESYIARITPPEYWRIFAFRFPGMFRFLHRQTRVQVDQGLSTINAVLPSVAAHNFVFGCEMTLASEPGVVLAEVPANTPQPPKNINELLARKMSLSFGQLSLEFAVDQLKTDATESHKPEIEFEIEIIGTDLQLNGITRNQQIKDFAERDKTVAEILTALVMKANPVTTVKSPTELDQKLIWVIGPDQQSILITTRDAAEKKSYELPDVFSD